MLSNHPGSAKIQNNGSSSGKGGFHAVRINRAGPVVPQTTRVTTILQPPGRAGAPVAQKRVALVPVHSGPQSTKQWSDYSLTEQCSIRTHYESLEHAAAHGVALQVTARAALTPESAALQSPYVVAALKEERDAAETLRLAAAELEEARAVRAAQAADPSNTGDAALRAPTERDFIYVSVAAATEQPTEAPAAFLAGHAAFTSLQAENRGWAHAYKQALSALNEQVLEAVCAESAAVGHPGDGPQLRVMLTGSQRVSGGLHTAMRYKCRLARAGTLFVNNRSITVQLAGNVVLAVRKELEPWEEIPFSVQDVPASLSDADVMSILMAEFKAAGCTITLQSRQVRRSFAAALESSGHTICGQSASQKLGITEPMQSARVHGPSGVTRKRAATKRTLEFSTRRDAAAPSPPPYWYRSPTAGVRRARSSSE